MKKIVIAPDSFKGTMSASRVIEIITEVMKQYFPETHFIGIPIADGGEGTLDILQTHFSIKRTTCQVHGPLFEPVVATYLLFEDTAFIELAQASGLPLVENHCLNPLYTTTYGVGELIKDALNHHISRLFLTLGGSATNDGGMGALIALGACFYDEHHQELSGIGENLNQIATMDLSQLDPRLKDVTITILCDVDNLLYGEKGATYTFGPQKGGTREILDKLEVGMKHYAQILEENTKTTVSNIKGVGAAGGFSAPFIALLNAKLKPGIQEILQLINFEKQIEDADLVITGEGRIDFQSAHGKVLYGIGQICQRKEIPCIAIGGCLGEGYEEVLHIGIQQVISTCNEQLPFEQIKATCEERLYKAVEQMCQKMRADRNE